MDWIRKHMSYGKKRYSVLFTAKKIKNQDCPDGWVNYWNDLRKEPPSIFSRVQGGGSVMVWATFCFNGQVYLIFLDGRRTVLAYYIHCRIIYYLFQNFQLVNNVYFSKLMLRYIRRALQITQVIRIRLKFKVLDWLSCRPDINPIENLWDILTLKVYENTRKDFFQDELKASTQNACHEMKLEIKLCTISFYQTTLAYLNSLRRIKVAIYFDFYSIT